MLTTATKIASMLQSNPTLISQIREIKDKKLLIDFMGKEAKAKKLALTKKEVLHFLDAGAKGLLQDVPKQKVLGAVCYNTSSDDDEENGGTTCVTSC